MINKKKENAMKSCAEICVTVVMIICTFIIVLTSMNYSYEKMVFDTAILNGYEQKIITYDGYTHIGWAKKRIHYLSSQDKL